jgi:large subunit ribosomal protein L34e
MTLPKNRSTSVRKIYKKLPKGRHTIHYKRRVKGKKHKDPISGQILPGVSSIKGLSKSQKRPNRKFGGTLSSKTSSEVLKIVSRIKQKIMTPDQVDIKLLPYVKQLLKEK